MRHSLSNRSRTSGSLSVGKSLKSTVITTTELSEALGIDASAGRGPRVVIAHTTKGKGVSFMENQVVWHYRPPSPEELELALSEVGG